MTAIGLRLCEEADFEALNCQPSSNFDRSTKVDLTTEPQLLVGDVVRWVFFFGRLSALAKTYSFAIFGCSVGLCELQMCMALSVGIRQIVH
jgi:hypothetical protein